MNDLISRNMAIKAIEDLPNCYNGFSDTYDKAYIIGVLEELIPIDAMQVVRCRDCKHWQYESCFVESEEGDADSIILDRFAFDFCSRAERKDEYVTLHNGDIHFKDEESEKAFYNALAERKEE